MKPRITYGVCECGKPLLYVSARHCSALCWRKSVAGEVIDTLTTDTEPLYSAERSNRDPEENTCDD